MTSEDVSPGSTGSDNGASRSPSVLQRLFTIDPNRFDIAFALVLLVYIGSLIILSFDVRPEARLVPLVAAVPTFVLLCLILVLLVSERASEVAAEFSETHLFGVEEQDFPQDGTDQTKKADETDRVEELFARRKRIAISFTVVLSLLGFVYLVGFLTAIPVFLIIFYRFRAKQSWPVTIGTTSLVWFFVIIVFSVLLDVRLWQGVLEIEVVSYLPI